MRKILFLLLICGGIFHSHGVYSAEDSCKIEGPFKLYTNNLHILGYTVEKDDQKNSYVNVDGKKYGPYKNVSSEILFFGENNYIYQYHDQKLIAEINDIIKQLKPGETRTVGGTEMVVYNGKTYGPYLNAQLLASKERKQLGFRYSEGGSYYLNIAGKKYGPHAFIGNSYGGAYFLFHPIENSYAFSYTKISDKKVYLSKDGKEFGPFEVIYNFSYSPNGKGFSYSYKKDGEYFIMKDQKMIGPFSSRVLDMKYTDDENLSYVIEENKNVTIFHLGKKYGPFPYSRFDNALNLKLSGDGKHFIFLYIGIDGKSSYILDGKQGVFREKQFYDISQTGITLIQMTDDKKYDVLKGSSSVFASYKKDGIPYISVFGKELPFVENDKVSGMVTLDGDYILTYTKNNSLYIDRCTLKEYNKKSSQTTNPQPTTALIKLTYKEKDLINSIILKFKKLDTTTQSSQLINLEKKFKNSRENTREYLILKELISKIKYGK